MRFKLRALSALLYLALGMAAAWHGPHENRSGELSIHAHACADAHHAPLEQDCALCSWQSLNQSQASSFRLPLPMQTALQTSVSIADARFGFSHSFRARAPPSV